ncbi:transposase [Micromonospora sp. NPDC049900]|uniref:transposase n=1 Tax=Micromonospora sp. NPDC049900 TaxID=3364275 RepID=UPI00379CF5D1
MASQQLDLLDPVNRFCDEALPANSIFAFLHGHRETLFPDGLIIDLFAAVGRRSVSPSVVATVMCCNASRGCRTGRRWTGSRSTPAGVTPPESAAGTARAGWGSPTPCWSTCGNARKYAHATTAEALIGPNASSRPSVLTPFHSYLRVSAWIMRPGHKHTDDDRADLADARRRCPDLDTVAGLACGFVALVRHQGTGQHLDAWINRARHAGYPEIRSFAAGLASDRDAVAAGLSQPWSSGPVEGQVSRIKTIKRQMYGRANPRPPPQTRPDYFVSHQQDQSQNVCQSQFSGGADSEEVPMTETAATELSWVFRPHPSRPADILILAGVPIHAVDPADAAGAV